MSALPPASRVTAVLAAAFSIAACSGDAASSFTALAESRNGGNASARSCNGTIGAVTVDEVTVPFGATCRLEGTIVEGDIKVFPGGTLDASAVRVDGNVQAVDAAAVTLRDASRVNGDVQVKRRALATVTDTYIGGDLQVEERDASLVARNVTVDGNVQVSKAATASLTELRVDGDVQFVENRRALSAVSTVVRGNFQVFKNLGGVTLTSNRVAQDLQCKENSPAPQGGNNEAGDKEDQCALL